MTRSYKKDIQLLMSILQRQNDIKEVMKRFGCSQNNLEQDKMAFDLCAFYLKAYIFSIIETKAIAEIKNRINYCNENAEKI